MAGRALAIKTGFIGERRVEIWGRTGLDGWSGGDIAWNCDVRLRARRIAGVRELWVLGSIPK